MWGIIRAAFTSAQLSLYDEQPALESWKILFGDKQLWTVEFMFTSALSYSKSILIWPQLKSIMWFILKIMILDSHQLVFIKHSLLVWFFFFGFFFCLLFQKTFKILFSGNGGKICLHQRARFTSVLWKKNIYVLMAIAYFWDF